MDPGIKLTKIWQDEDLFEIEIKAFDNSCSILTKTYVDHSFFKDQISSLEIFKEQIHGGIIDIEMGKFGPEYASGALNARLKFYEKYKILVAVRVQSEFHDFDTRAVASEGVLYFKTAPLLLKCFIDELKELDDGRTKTAYLQAA